MGSVVAMVNDARLRGVNVQANIYPYTRGNNSLGSIIPPWAHEGGREKMIARLKDTALHARLKKDIEGLQKAVISKEKQLGNETFRSRAPEMIIKGLEATLAEQQVELQKLQDRLSQLG
jgi:N-acyl-D-aspartate/D-glutamate deacylase